MTYIIKDSLKVIILSIVVLLSVYLVLAQGGWVEPTVAPPGGNAAAPLNTGSTGQSKTGGLILNTGGAVNGLIVSSGNVGIGTANPNRTLSVIGGFASGEGTASDVDGRVSLTWDSVANDASLSAYQGGYVKLRMDASPILLMTGNVGIGAADPSQKLDVNGQLRIRGGSPEANKVLTASDVNGNAAWALTTLSSSYVGTCGVVAEDFPYNNPTCKCNAGERIMLPSSFAGQVCSVENQNSASVQGRAQSFSSCTFSCFR